MKFSIAFCSKNVQDAEDLKDLDIHARESFEVCE